MAAMDLDLELPPDDTYAWCLERLLEHPGVSEEGITAAVMAAVGEDVAALDPALQCRLTLRWLETLVRTGRLDRSVPDSLVKLRELSGEVVAGPRVDPSQLACSEALLIEVRTAIFVEKLREHYLSSEAELRPSLEAAFPWPLSPEARHRANELRAGLASDTGKDVMLDRHRLEPVLSALGQFLTRAKQALGPSVLSIINDDINNGRYLPGEGSLLAQPAVPVARGTPVQPQRQQPPGRPLVGGAAQGAVISPGRAGAGRAAASVGHVRQQQQQAQPSYSVPKPSFHQGPTVGSPLVPRRSQGGVPSAGHSPSLSFRNGGGRAGVRTGQRGRKRGRAAAGPPRGEGREPGDFDLPETGGASAMEEEEAAVAAPNLAKATDELKATGGEDPLPAVLRAAQEVQPQRPAAAEAAREEGEQAGSAGEEEDEAEGRREPEEDHKQPQPAAKEPELSDEELDGAPNLQMPPQPARRVPLTLQATGAGVRDALRADLLAAPRAALVGGRRKVGRWTETETNTLLELIMEYGEGSWAAMHADRRAEQNMPGRNQVDLKDKWRNLKKQGYEDVVLERRSEFLRKQKEARAEQRRQQQEELEQDDGAAQQEQEEGGDGEEAPQQEQQQQEQEEGQDVAGEEQADGVRRTRRRRKQQQQQSGGDQPVGVAGTEAEYQEDGSESSEEEEDGERRWTQEDEAGGEGEEEDEEDDEDAAQEEEEELAGEMEKDEDDDQGVIFFTALDAAAADGGEDQQPLEEQELLAVGEAEAEAQEAGAEQPVGQEKRDRSAAAALGGNGDTPLGKRRKKLKASQVAAAEAKPSGSKGRQRGQQAQQQDEEAAIAGASTGTGGGAGSDGGAKRGRGRSRKQPPAPGGAVAAAGEVHWLQAEEKEGAGAGGRSGSEAGAATRSGPRTRSGHKSRSHQSGPSRQTRSHDKAGTTEVVDLLDDDGEEQEEYQDAAAGGDPQQEQPGAEGGDEMNE